MAIDVKKINVVLPEGVSKVGEISLEGNTAELTVVGSTVGPKTISASYDGGTSKSGMLTVTEATVFNILAITPSDQVFIGDSVKLIATFSKTPIITEVNVLAPAGFVATAEPAVKGNNIEATYTAGGPVTDNAKFVVNFRDGEDEKEAVIKVLEKPAVLQTVKATPESVRVSGESKVVLTFDKEPELAKMEEVIPAGLTKTLGPVLNENTIEYTLTGKTAGAQEVVFTYNTQEAKRVTITVVADAVVKTATPAPTEIEVGADSVITVEYDKAFVEGQAAMKVVLGEGLSEKVPYAENPAKNGGTITVTGGQAGETRTVTFQLGGAEKVCNIKVVEKTQVQAVDVDPKSIEAGKQAKVKITL